MSASEFDNTQAGEAQEKHDAVVVMMRDPHSTQRVADFDEFEETPSSCSPNVCTGHSVEQDKLTREVMKLLQELDAKSGMMWRDAGDPAYKFDRYPSNRYLA